MLSLRGGFTHFLFLAAVYVPAALVLRERIYRLARENNLAANPKQLTEWVKEQGLEFSALDQLKFLSAIVSPIGAAVVAKVFG